MVAEEKEATTSSLILDSLEIQGFRGFRHLQIERLGRVNLITGKNNVGKTALLEALWIYANNADTDFFWELLIGRGESSLPLPDETNIFKKVPSLKYLFYGRKDIRQIPEPITIGPISSEEKILTVKVDALKPKEGETPRYSSLVLAVSKNGGAQGKYYPINDLFAYRPQANPQQASFISTHGLNKNFIEALWERISLTKFEEDVIAALQIIAPNVVRVGFVSRESVSSERIPVVKIKDVEEPILLSSLGEGMNRLFSIALALVNAKDGMLLIDEVESGLHYSVQPDIWKLIFETATRLNVQVFATTHSWDCIEAFQKAATESDEEGLMIRLAEKKGEIVSDVFGERELKIATRENIELR